MHLFETDVFVVLVYSLPPHLEEQNISTNCGRDAASFLKLYPQKIMVLLGGPMLYRVVTDAVGSSNDSGQTSEEDEAKNEANLQQVYPFFTDMCTKSL